MQEYQMNVRLSPALKETLDRVIQRATEASPLLPPTTSEIIRRLIIEADASGWPATNGHRGDCQDKE